MNRLPFVILLGLAPLLGVAATRRSAGPAAPEPAGVHPTPAERAHDTYVEGVDSLTAAVAALPSAARGDAASALAAYRRARRAYKRVEYLVADALPDAELALNGPPLPRPHETTVDATVPPTGLQVIEAALVPAVGLEADSIVRRQVALMGPTLAGVRNVRLEPGSADGRFFDAVRQEIARITTLGLAGFDATVTRDGIAESAEALRGVRAGLQSYRPADAADPAWAELDRRLGAAIAELDRDPDFDRFDRLRFITGAAAPLAAALTRFQASLGIPRTARPTAWFTAADAIYDARALDPFDYAPSDARPLRPDVVALGRRLFFDPRLSEHERRSCATCHEPARAFTDGRAVAQVDPGSGRVRNVPTLLNAALQPFQFADQRSRALEDQIAVVLANPREMAMPLDRLVPRLRADSGLAAAFAAAYEVPRDDAVSARRVQTAVAAFVRSLVVVRSRFDRAVAGGPPR